MICFILLQLTERKVIFRVFLFIKIYTLFVASLHAHIAIKNNYPKTVPIFFLTMKYNEESNSGNSDEIRVRILISPLTLFQQTFELFRNRTEYAQVAFQQILNWY